MKKIILLGASSLLATNFKNIFVNYEIYFFSRVNNFDFKNFYKLDIYDIERIEKTFSVIKPDFVFNFIANTNLQECEITNQSYVNNIFSDNIVYLCNKTEAKYIYISTDQVYYETLNSEQLNLKINQKSQYAKQKRLSEIYIEKNLLNYLIIRTNFFNYSNLKNNNLIGNILNNKIVNGYEDFKFKTIHSFDLLRIILLLIERGDNGIFNISCNEYISKFDFINLIVDHYGLSIKIKMIKAPKEFKYIRSQIDLDLNKISKITKIPKLTDSIKNLNKYEYKYSI